MNPAAAAVPAAGEGIPSLPDEATREKMRALKEEYKAPFTEAGMKVVKVLTPEQRKYLTSWQEGT